MLAFSFLPTGDGSGVTAGGTRDDGKTVGVTIANFGTRSGLSPKTLPPVSTPGTVTPGTNVVDLPANLPAGALTPVLPVARSGRMLLAGLVGIATAGGVAYALNKRGTFR